MKQFLFTIGTILTLTIHAFGQQDLQLDTLIFQTTTNAINHNYYSKIPWSQAKGDTVRFKGVVTNNSSLPNTNVVLASHISTPLSTDTLYSAPINLTPFQTDTIEITAPFTFSDSAGQYAWFFSCTSDSTDTILSNNSKDTFTIAVTDTTFARDRNASGNFKYGPNGYELAVMYEVLDTVKATSVTLNFGSSTSNSPAFSIYIYDESFQLISSEGLLIFRDLNPIETHAIPEVLLTPGKYFVSFRTYWNYIFFQKSDFVADSGIAYVDTSDSGSWMPVSFIPPIRLNVSDNLNLCNIKLEFEFFGVDGCDSVIVVPSNGVPPYTFLWENGDTTNYKTNLVPFAHYQIQVTDSVGCTSKKDVVCLIGSVNEQTISQFSVFPNPTRETINVEFSQSVNFQEYAFEIYNVLGKRVLSFTLNAKLTSVDVSHLKPGVYICKYGESKVRVIIW